ncbi:hypothetical protein BDR22DRAFT_890299 [Usnea florida]
MHAQRESTENNNFPRNPSRSHLAHKDRASSEWPPSPDPHDFTAGSLDDPAPSLYSTQSGHARELRRAIFLKPATHRAFLTFLSSYGPSGVSLRVLIMLATLRHTESESKNYWLASGEPGTLEQTEINLELNVWVFQELIPVASFQEVLEYLDYIDVMYPEGSHSDKASQYWHMDERVWIIRASEWSEPSAPITDSAVLRGLLHLLIGIPDKDVSLAAQRQREVYYYHARLLMRRVIQSQRFLEDNPDFLMQAVFVALQLLTHRYHSGDSLLLDFVRKYSVHSLRLDMSVMLLWAELKKSAFEEDYDGLRRIRDHVLRSVEMNRATPRQNGFVGFVLVDLMKSAKALHFEDLVADTLKAGTEWVDSAQRDGTTIEKIALCEMLATFGIHARNEIIQTEYCLFYGYHLSRAGFLEQGDHFLARGLKGRDRFPLWSYEMERVSNALRLGKQNEAEQMLMSLRELAIQYRDRGRVKNLVEPRHESVLWKHSGECAEVFVLLNLYEADCSASAGRLDDACAKLKSGIDITSFVYDAYIQVLRVTLEMRLLVILVRQNSLEEALPVALRLASETLDERMSSTWAPAVVYGIAQQLLDLSSTLLSAGNATASISLLESIKGIGAILPSELSKDLKPYAGQRMAKAHQYSEMNRLSEYERNQSQIRPELSNSTKLQIAVSKQRQRIKRFFI